MKKVLIIEDEVALGVGLRTQLKDKYEVYIAPNGLEGLKVYQEKKPDLVLLDVAMPVMTGEEFLQKLEEKNEKTNVVVLSNYAEHIGVVSKYERILKSDISLKELKAKVASILND